VAERLAAAIHEDIQNGGTGGLIERAADEGDGWGPTEQAFPAEADELQE
jgi:hypothetical protein